MTTSANPAATPAENVLDRAFEVECPNEKWVVDVTYIATGTGWMYLAAVMDLSSRRIVGWAMAAKQDETLVEQALAMALTALQESIGKVEGSLVLDEKGHLHLPSLDKAVPEDVERLKKRVYALLPHLPLADVLLEVDNWTGFLRHFTDLTTGDALIGEQKLELVAALMGMGMNLGLEKMAESCPFTYRQLSWSIDWHLREETLLAALTRLDNFVLAVPLSSAWGAGTRSSSDGIRFHMGVQAANAEYNAKYFQARRGTNMSIHAADIWVPFGKPKIIGTNEEAL